MIGILSSALLISVLTQKLVLNRWEKYLHNFMLSIAVAKDRRGNAANVIIFAVKIWFYQRRRKCSQIEIFRLRWKLHRSIERLKQGKHEERKLTDHCLCLADLANLQRQSNDRTFELRENSLDFREKIERIEEKLDRIQNVLRQFSEKPSNF